MKPRKQLPSQVPSPSTSTSSPPPLSLFSMPPNSPSATTLFHSPTKTPPRYSLLVTNISLEHSRFISIKFSHPCVWSVLADIETNECLCTMQVIKPSRVELFENDEILVLEFPEELPIGFGVLSIRFEGILNDRMKGFYRRWLLFCFSLLHITC